MLAIGASHLNQPVRCTCSISTISFNRGKRLEAKRWPAQRHVIQLRGHVLSARQSSTAAAVELSDETVVDDTAPGPQKYVQRAGNDKYRDKEALLLVKEAFAASKTVPHFEKGFVLAGRKTSHVLNSFFQSESQIATFDYHPLHITLLKKFASTLNLQIITLDKKHLADNSSIVAASKSDNLQTFLLKKGGFVLPQEGVRRHMESVIDNFVSDGITSDTTARAFVRYVQSQVESVIDAVFLHSHSFITSLCQGDISRVPTLALLDKLGRPIDTPRSIDKDLWPCQLVLKEGGKTICERQSPHIGKLRRDFASIIGTWLEYHISPRKDIKDSKGEDHNRSMTFSFPPGEWTPSEFLSRAARALNFGYITCTQKIITPPVPGIDYDGETPGFCQTTMGVSDHRFESKAIWTTETASKKLAVVQACTAIRPYLQDAYESGKLLSEDYQRFARYWRKPKAPPLETFKVVNSSFSTALIDARSITRMVDVLKDLRNLDQEGKVQEWKAIDESLHEQIPMQTGYRAMGVTRPGPRSDLMARMRAIKATLPISQFDYKETICDSIQKNDVTIIKAATGSGKTTQVPQFLLDQVTENGHNIVCTQPRRIAAISVAKRVADERGQPVGDQVGFQVRFKDEAPSANFGINYMTAGYLLRLFEADPKWVCKYYTHIIFDEVHERDLDTDLLLTGMKNLMLHKHIEGLKMPKLILMSATIDADMLVHYFKDAPNPPTVASIDVPGKAYHVSTTMLEEFWPQLRTKYPQAMGQDVKHTRLMELYIKDQLSEPESEQENTAVTSSTASLGPDLASGNSGEIEMSEETAEQLDAQNADKYIIPIPLLVYLIKDVLKQSDSGDVLVFLPGLSEIDSLADLLVGKLEANHIVSKLHSSFGDSNFDAWEPISPGFRRVFLATNIAETSITLPNVTVVIDTGYSKQGEFDQTSQIESFGHRWISKAEVAQRRGRAGRTREGQYFATYSQKQYDTMADSQTPEMLRTKLTSIVLRTEFGKAFRQPAGGELSKPGGVLALAPSPPEQEDIDAAVEQLTRMHALTADLKLTPLGALLARLPVEPELGRLVLMALLLRCLGPGILVAAYSPELPLLQHPEKIADVARARKEFAGKTYDDRLGDAAAFISYAMADLRHNIEEKSRMEKENFLRINAFSSMTRYTTQLIDCIMLIMDIPRRFGRDFNTTPIINILFTGSMAFPNTNSSSADLIKALIVASSGMRVAKWDGKHWRNETNTHVMPSPRSVNHDGPKRELRASNAIRREPGDLLCYLNLRKSPEGPAWAHETTVMSPLGAMLFAESLRVVDDDVLIVNEWIKYKIEPQGELGFTSAEVAKILLEYRKALDRFMAQAFSDVDAAPARLAAVRSGETRASKFNTFLRNSSNPVRELFTNSLVDIFKFDKECKQLRKEQRRAAAEAEAPDGSKLKLFLQQLKDNV